jgi:hypothetical protein
VDRWLDALEVGDEPAAWSAAGFAVDGDTVVVGAVRVRCLGDGAGHDRWRVGASDPAAVPVDVDGIATIAAAERPAIADVVHPNGVVALDHVVLRSPDLDRTTDALVHLGADLRRVRDIGSDGRAAQQRFLRMGETILELVGPAVPTGEGPCRIWGVAFVTDDIDAAAARLGARCAAPKAAVQPGRRIATIRTADLGIGPAIALMTPHVRAGR